MNTDSTLEKLTTGSRMAGDERRSQILSVAVQLFSQRGFRGTTTREIAAAAGVSEAMVFRHFATKHDLYAAIIDFKACGSEGGLKPFGEIAEFVAAKDDYGVFYNFALGALSQHERDRDFMRLLMFSALENHELADIFFERFILNIYQFLGSYIEERQGDGVFRGMNPRIVVRSFVGMLIHHSLNINLWDKQKRLLDVSNEEAARSFTEILLGGIKIKG